MSTKFHWWTATLLVVATATLSMHLSRAEETDAGNAEAAPKSELDKVVAVGREIISHTGTHPLSKEYVGNDLSCSSCHLDAGTDARAATFIGVATAYPAWSPREKRVITLEDRVLNCFMRSMNGTRPPNGSQVSVAMTAYIASLSQGKAMKMNHQKPLGPNHVPMLNIDLAKADIERGKELYANECAYCHGDKGEGSDDGPPVWGPRSYNKGAGLSRNDKLASWLKVAMPLGDPYLTEQQALDLAAYINSKPRPEFKLEEHLPAAEKMGEYNAESAAK